VKPLTEPEDRQTDRRTDGQTDRHSETACTVLLVVALRW